MRNIVLSALLTSLCALSTAQSTSTAITTYAPVPSTGIGPTVPSKPGYRIESLGKGAYMITDSVYQALFLVATNGVIVVDAPPTIGNNMLRGIRTITNLPISHMVYSHAHGDHIAGAYTVVGKDTTIIAHEETRKALAVSVNKARPLPNITFTQDYELHVGNQTLQLSYKGVNHELGNIFIYAPVQKILMLVDVIYPGWIPFARLAESQSIPGWIQAHDQILTYDFKYVLGGHLNRWGSREDVLIQKEYVTDLYNNCVYAIQATLNSSISTVVAANPNNAWALVRYLDDQQTEICVNKTNEKWLGRLAGADVYGFSNAETMVESLKLDYGILGSAGVRN